MDAPLNQVNIHLMLFFSTVSSYNCIWSAWGQCSATCGAGKQERNIKSHEQNGGNICRGERTKNCNHEKPCPGIWSFQN